MRARALERFLRVDRSKVHGLGVFTTVALPAREMILEYRGEVIRQPVADRREEAAKQVIIEKAAAAAAAAAAAYSGSASAAGADSAAAAAALVAALPPAPPPAVSAGELAEASTYMFTVDPSSGLIVDATKKGNITRFVNHCCEPNCVTRSVTLEG
jgi:uncharacterized NAD(P)/FAD-binding protein YdhS